MSSPRRDEDPELRGQAGEGLSSYDLCSDVFTSEDADNHLGSGRASELADRLREWSRFCIRLVIGDLGHRATQRLGAQLPARWPGGSERPVQCQILSWIDWVALWPASCSALLAGGLIFRLTCPEGAQTTIGDECGTRQAIRRIRRCI